MSPGESPKRRHVRGFATKAVRGAAIKIVRATDDDRPFEETQFSAEKTENRIEETRSVDREVIELEPTSSKPSCGSGCPEGIQPTADPKLADHTIAESTIPHSTGENPITADPIIADPITADPRITIADPTAAVEASADQFIASNAQQTSESPEPSIKEQAIIALGKLGKEFRSVFDWLWTLRAPFVLLAALGVVPHLINVWILAVLVKPIVGWVLPRCPQPLLDKLQASMPQTLRRSELLRDLGEGTDQALPFILFWMYMFFIPFALCWMAIHWLKEFMPQRKQLPAAENNSESKILFTQNKGTDSEQSDNNFYHSKAFGIMLILFFALGIPAFISAGVYEKLGVASILEREPPDALLSFVPPSRPPAVEMPPLGVSLRESAKRKQKQPQPNDQFEFATVVASYVSYWPWLRDMHIEPTFKSVFFVHFYLFGLGSALSILFFRAWLTFPLNFLRNEHDVEFTADGIKKRTMKGWFLSVITLNRWSTEGGPDSLKWHEIKSLRHLQEGFTKLYPLPEVGFKRESLTYKLLNKLAAFFDGITNQANAANFLVFSAAEKGNDFGRNIKIDLKDLNREQRAKLFYSVKQWAPHVQIRKTAEEKLVGSVVLTDVRYTQLWFDLLTSRSRPQRQNILSIGDSLKNNQFTIEERLSTGGQATTYLARNSSGKQCVLKEFILATSSSSGALIESAREFEAEVSLLSQLNHSGIVRLDDYFCEDGRVYVVLEYVQGQSLRQMISQHGALDQSEVVRISLATCEILEYLHGCNPPIVHRDITPENIIIQPDGAVKLIDFSLAVKQDGRQTTDSCAKQAFTPPEQFREEVCVQSDIYALGATIYFMLLAANPKPISRSSPGLKAPHVVPKLNSIVERATELDLRQRYESVKWLKLDLQQAAAALNPIEQALAG